jgi:GT2 family glycosyltransferase
MISVVILSNTANESIKQMTQECINSVHKASATEANVVVVEMNKSATFYNADIIRFPESFHFNRMLNIGINYCLDEWPESEYIVLANNDLVFHNSWLEAMKPHFSIYDSLSPKSPNWDQHNALPDGVHEGWAIGREFAGWCLVFKTESLERLLPLDEQFEFWFADNDMTMEMQKLGMRHALVTDSHVSHLFSKSHSLLDNVSEYTADQAPKFKNKWENTGK